MELERDPWRGVLRDLRRVTRRAELLEKSSVMPGAPVQDDLAVSYLAQRSMERWPEFPDAEGHRVRPEPKYPSLMLDRIVRWFLDFLDMAITVTFLDVSRGLRGGTRRGGRHPRKSDGPTPPWHLHRWRSGSSELGRKLSIAAVLSVVAGILGPIIGLNVWSVMLFPLGLGLIAAAWLQGDRLGLWIFLIGGFVLQWVVAIAAMLKYG